MNLHENYLRLKQQAYENLSQKGRSTRPWVAMLESTPILLGQERSRLLLAVNTGMRLLDDIADGDMPPPENHSRIAYLEQKHAFVREPFYPQDEIDLLFTYCYEQSAKVGIDISEELDAFFQYFLFDANRLRTGKVFTKEELEKAYDNCDIFGTIKGCLKLFGDDPEKYDLLVPLGRATRTYYTMRDWNEDIAAGFVNIPKEDMARLGVQYDELSDISSPGIQTWFHEQATYGLNLLDVHRNNMAVGNFKWLGRLALPLAYERPARGYFENVLLR